MKAYKFVIPPNDFRALPSDVSFSFAGCVAVCLAETADAAKSRLKQYAAQNGLDSRWLEVATTVEIEIIDGGVLAWAQI